MSRTPIRRGDDVGRDNTPPAVDAVAREIADWLRAELASVHGDRREMEPWRRGAESVVDGLNALAQWISPGNASAAESTVVATSEAPLPERLRQITEATGDKLDDLEALLRSRPIAIWGHVQPERQAAEDTWTEGIAEMRASLP